MKNRLQKSYDTRIESARRALSIAVPCIFSRAHSASISPDHFFAAAEITRLRMPPEVCSSEYCNLYIHTTSTTSFKTQNHWWASAHHWCSEFFGPRLHPLNELCYPQIIYRPIPQGSGHRTIPFFRSRNSSRGRERGPKTKVSV